MHCTFKYSVSKDITESNSPLMIWNYSIDRSTSVHNLTSRNTFKLQALTSYADLTGERVEISNLCQFG